MPDGLEAYSSQAKDFGVDHSYIEALFGVETDGVMLLGRDEQLY